MRTRGVPFALLSHRKMTICRFLKLVAALRSMPLHRWLNVLKHSKFKSWIDVRAPTIESHFCVLLAGGPRGDSAPKLVENPLGNIEISFVYPLAVQIPGYADRSFNSWRPN